MKKYIGIGVVCLCIASVLWWAPRIRRGSQGSLNAEVPSFPGPVEEKEREASHVEGIHELPLPLTNGGKSPFVAIAKMLMPAVVSVDAEQVIKVKSPFHDFFEDPFFDFFKRQFPEFGEREVRRPVLGSGVIVSSDGYILTNNHVIEKAKKIIIKTIDEKEYTATLVGTDPMTDVAVLKIDANNLPYAKLGDSDKIEVGDWVMAIGNPFQLMGTVTVGVVSAKERTNLAIAGGGPQIQHFIQTDAAINPGNSGGPLVNLAGEVVGINTAIKSAGFSVGNIGIGFAIPSNIAKKVMNDLIKYKEVKRGWLGVYYKKLDPGLAEAYGLKEVKGVLVTEVIKDSPAEEAGIKSEDIILEWNGKEVTDKNFAVLVSETPIGERVKVKLWRDNRELSVWVKVGKRTAEVAESEEMRMSEKWFGLEVGSLRSEEAKRFGIEEREGVLVVDVEGGSVAEWAGIRPGDVIKKVGELEIKDLRDYERARKKYAKIKKPVVFKLKRGGRTIIVALKAE